VFSTWSGTPIEPGSVLRRWVFPACKQLGLPHATWLTFRRTCLSWTHDKGVPGKVVAQMLGHASVDTTLNVYTQVIDGALRIAAQKVGDGSQLFTEALRRRTHTPLPKAGRRAEGGRRNREPIPNEVREWLLGLDSNQQPSG